MASSGIMLEYMWLIVLKDVSEDFKFSKSTMYHIVQIQMV